MDGSRLPDAIHAADALLEPDGIPRQLEVDDPCARGSGDSARDSRRRSRSGPTPLPSETASARRGARPATDRRADRRPACPRRTAGASTSSESRNSVNTIDRLAKAPDEGRRRVATLLSWRRAASARTTSRRIHARSCRESMPTSAVSPSCSSWPSSSVIVEGERLLKRSRLRRRGRARATRVFGAATRRARPSWTVARFRNTDRRRSAASRRSAPAAASTACSYVASAANSRDSASPAGREASARGGRRACERRVACGGTR